MSRRRYPAPDFPIVRHAPGLEATQGLPNGGMDFFAPGTVTAPRRYRDENDGWTTIRRRKKAKKQSRA